jgi:outer membrane autotransporter protein
MALFFLFFAPVPRLFGARAFSFAISMAFAVFGAHRRPVNRLYFTGRTKRGLVAIATTRGRGASAESTAPTRTSVAVGLFCAKPKTVASNSVLQGLIVLMGGPFSVDGAGIEPTSGFAAEAQTGLSPDVAMAYASILKAPPRPAFDQRWTMWGSAFGGYNTTKGDPVVGSNDVTASDFGFAAGADYRLSPQTVLGFALAGGGTNWGLAQNLGGGRSDAFQAGVYGATYRGPAYAAASLAFANHWLTTDRFAPGDHLQASFDAQSYGARLEGGYRFALSTARSVVGVTPYAAAQTQLFRTPSYSETDLTGTGFGLSYNAMSATDTRSELGARFDNLQVLDNRPLLLRARVAWAHDWVSNPALGATFETLPGASFIVNGAAAPKNSALTSASAELKITPGLSLAVKLDGEFASGAQTYAGTGTLRYAW